MARIHSADIARRANKQASWIDRKLHWIKKYKPEPLADILLDRLVGCDQQQAIKKWDTL